MIEHCNKRMKERMGIKSEAKREKIAKNAYERGKTIDQFNGKDRKYLERIEARTRMNDERRSIRVYQDKIFVFDNDLCITILHPPKTFGKKIPVRKERNDVFARDLAYIGCA